MDTTVKCPVCKKDNPESAAKCQYCFARFSSIPRPPSIPKPPTVPKAPAVPGSDESVPAAIPTPPVINRPSAAELPNDESVVAGEAPPSPPVVRRPAGAAGVGIPRPPSLAPPPIAPPAVKPPEPAVSSPPADDLADDDWIPDDEASRLIDLAEMGADEQTSDVPASSDSTPSDPASSDPDKTVVMAYTEPQLVEEDDDDEVSSEDVTPTGLTIADVAIPVPAIEDEDMDSDGIGLDDDSEDEDLLLDSDPPPASSVDVSRPAPVASAPKSVSATDEDDDWIPETEPSSLIALDNEGVKPLGAESPSVMDDGGRGIRAAQETRQIKSSAPPVSSRQEMSVPPPPRPSMPSPPRPSVPSPPRPSTIPAPAPRVSAPVPVPAPATEAASIKTTTPSTPFATMPQTVPEPVETGSMLSHKQIVILSVAAFVVTLGVALTLMVMLNKPAKEVETIQLEGEEEASLALNPADEPASDTGSDEAKKDSPAESTSPKPSAVVEPSDETIAGPVPAPGTECTPLSRYSKKLPWKSELERVLKARGVKSVCALFGTSMDQLGAVYSEDVVVVPSGMDLIFGGGRLEVYPSRTVGSREPSIEYLFVSDQLYQIRLKYRETIARKVTAKTLGKMFGKGKKGKDHLGRKVTRFSDKDLLAGLFEEEWYGRTLKTLVFTSRQIDGMLDEGRKERQQAEALFKEAEELYYAWKFDEALEKYRKTLSLMPRLGAALVKQGLILTRLEQFDEVVALSEKTLQISKDAEAQAEAHGLLAVAALAKGDSKEALAQFRKAAYAMPMSTRFESYIKELETGEYAKDRVVLTAARMDCIEQGKSRSTINGVLARGNFIDEASYKKALKSASRDKKFKKAVADIMQWECR